MAVGVERFGGGIAALDVLPDLAAPDKVIWSRWQPLGLLTYPRGPGPSAWGASCPQGEVTTPLLFPWQRAEVGVFGGQLRC